MQPDEIYIWNGRYRECLRLPDSHNYCFDNLWETLKCKVLIDMKKEKIDEEITCFSCSEEFPREETTEVEFFDTPFKKEGKMVRICEECYEWPDEEGFFFCSECGRFIAENFGMRMNYKIFECEKICVDCYQKRMFEEGQPEEDFLEKGGQIEADFYDEEELEKQGFKKIESYSVGLLRSGTKGRGDINKAKKKALELIEKGMKVIINIDDASSVGGGGYFSLWAKE